MEQAIRLSPRDPLVGIWCSVIGRVHLLQSRIGEAIFWLEKARRTYPGFALIITYACLASAYALENQIERVNAALAEAQSLSIDDRYSSIARLKAIE